MCIFSGSVAGGVFAEITNVAFECGISPERAGTIMMYGLVAEAVSRHLWSLVARRLETVTCHIIYTIMLLIGQTVGY